MDSFSGKLAVVTGGGSGMGRELVRQLAAQGCSVATCDWHADTVAETAIMAGEAAPPGVRNEERCLRRLGPGAGPGRVSAMSCSTTC